MKTCLQKAMESSEARPTKQRNSKANSRTSRRMSSLVEPKITRKEEILNHDNTTTNCGDKIVKAATGLVQEGRCKVCHERGETIDYLVAGCKVLANSEYLSRYNRALMIMAVAWA